MVNDRGGQIRVLPRFGNINERRHQLHEVIRLSGMNMVINDLDMPLIIKVASILKTLYGFILLIMKIISNVNNSYR
jgi:starch synthase